MKWSSSAWRTVAKTVSMLLTIFALTSVGYAQDPVPPPEDGVRDLVWSPNGDLLAVVNPDGRIIIQDRNNRVIFELGGDETVARVAAWSPDGRWLATGSSNTTIRLWNIRNGRLAREFGNFFDGVFNLSWHPDGNVLLASGFDTFQAWDTNSWMPIIQPLSVSITDISWSPDGSQFAFTSTPNNVAIATLAPIQESPARAISGFEGHTHIPTAVNWDSSGTRLVSSGGFDGSVRLWNVETGTQIALLLQTTETVNDAIFVEDGAKVIAVTNSGTIYTIDVATGSVTTRTLANIRLWTVDWNPVNDLVALGGLTIETGNRNIQSASLIDADTGYLEIVSP